MLFSTELYNSFNDNDGHQRIISDQNQQNVVIYRDSEVLHIETSEEKIAYNKKYDDNQMLIEEILGAIRSSFVEKKGHQPEIQKVENHHHDSKNKNKKERGRKKSEKVHHIQPSMERMMDNIEESKTNEEDKKINIKKQGQDDEEKKRIEGKKVEQDSK